jgi:adenylate kinase
VSELNLILLGPPGAGKGTQAGRLHEEFHLPYIGTGDLLREHREQGSELGREAAGYMERGELVPDALVVAMILEKIEEEGEDGFLLDGFPRNTAQADALGAELDKRGRRLTAVLLIDAPDDVVIQRLSGRRQCADGHLYHVAFDPPERDGVCDRDGKPLIQREDDKPETIRRRLKTYHDQTEPLIDYYEDRGVLRRFDGARPQAEVHDHIRATLSTLRLEERL